MQQTLTSCFVADPRKRGTQRFFRAELLVFFCGSSSTHIVGEEAEGRGEGHIRRRRRTLFGGRREARVLRRRWTHLEGVGGWVVTVARREWRDTGSLSL